MIDTDRAVRACEDVLTVETFAPGMARVITLGGAYTVDARGQGCQCADKEYNLGHGEMCKHHAAAFLATSDAHPTPFMTTENVDERPVATDGGADRPDDCECAGADKLVCWPCKQAGFDDPPDADADSGRPDPTRSEPADFGHGESTGVQDL